ncbi:NarK family nitrate/nitrite MFS transporter [Sediminicurvatus halobius]|uniref:Nitrate/nitrite transporter n=1 Tax=Sediminicurvatus halobius TaxID=2182432 RepID=A0A2U2MWS7_9GAMM|nr:NarK family nitrate/nitrite MFS transporter [Spiribacter halobius]PWG61318.1 nitrate/nitrite transporter [Spiribacter halobius]UEX79695.1 NarK family nitrate/nitrite MFS transporter [Spiribacter halobius]
MATIATPGNRHLITDWRPEDAEFWESYGKRVATRNLWISIPCLLLAFSVWMVFSAVAVRLNSIGFTFTDNQLFWLAALPGLSGATLRIFYSFMVPIFGGRRWTVISTASLVIPALGMGLAVQSPDTPYWVFIVLALLCGFGGGNFASSMANISFFYPKSQQGTALGLNAGLGNLGVSVMQFVVPAVITTGAFAAVFGGPQELSDGGRLWLQNAGFIWVPFILLFTVLAWFGMNDLATAQASFRDQAVIFKRKHQWLMTYLYIATFGSFIGYSAGFPLLIKTQFPDVDPLQYAFLGPMVGALIRPVGGWMSDKLGGARVTFWNFVVMIAAVFGVVYFLPVLGTEGNFWGFFGMFMLLFITTGVGNGSTFRMIPVIFRNIHERGAEGQGEEARLAAIKAANKESAATLGFSSAIAAYGAFFIPKAYGTSIAVTGGPTAALYAFAIYYLTCIAVTWWFYHRRGAEAPC